MQSQEIVRFVTQNFYSWSVMDKSTNKGHRSVPVDSVFHKQMIDAEHQNQNDRSMFNQVYKVASETYDKSMKDLKTRKQARKTANDSGIDGC